MDDLRYPQATETWRLSSGVAAQVWQTPRSGPGRACRGAVVVQHGFGEYAQRYVHHHHQLIPALVANGLDVYAIDAWGHGQSPGERGVTHVGRAVGDHLELRRAIAARARAGTPVFAIGHSLGGLITAGSVVTDPTSLTGVVLMSPALPPEVSALARRIIGLAARTTPARPLPRPAAPTSGLSRIPVQVAEAEQDTRLLKKQVPFLVAATALDVAGAVRSQAQQWRVPTLALHGTADVYANPDQTSEFLDTIASRDKRCELLHGGFHELLNDLDAERTLATIMGWIDKRLPS